MGGNIKQKKASDPSSSSTRASSPSLLGFLRPRRVQKDNARDTEAVTTWKLKVWPSDYDQGTYVADPGINRKASAFIEKFHASRDSPIAV
ncbi:hypothetical protein MLD38_012096 [Melastoma candidum]|uniref:Uncharacterized protein n=1 Tax=Melastoma candidum TaxID=119954 RepID=A0ACB9R4T3_9MYRT|nr:hypothetical protein MLD38_012096 [Melastoma candidum]